MSNSPFLLIHSEIPRERGNKENLEAHGKGILKQISRRSTTFGDRQKRPPRTDVNREALEGREGKEEGRDWKLMDQTGEAF